MRKTRDRIIRAFLELLHENPYNRITVRMITEKCGMHRNTFYYYFEDLPVLLEYIVRDGISRVIRSRFEYEPSLSCVYPILRCAERYRTEIEHVCTSLSITRIIEIIEDTSAFIVDYCFETVAGDLITGVDSSDFAALRSYYISLVSGILLEWIRHGMEPNLMEYAERLHRMAKLFRGGSFLIGRAELKALCRAREEAELEALKNGTETETAKRAAEAPG